MCSGYIASSLFQLTPSRRATILFFVGYNVRGDFNSRPHGGRLWWAVLTQTEVIFQLTPSRRATVHIVYVLIRWYVFQLTPSRRATETDREQPQPNSISTHALTEGDEHGYQIADSNSIFQLTPSRRATSSSLSSGNSGIYFNSRPHGGRRHDGSSLEQVGSYFNSRPHGGRPRHSRRTSWIWHFNSRPHGGRLNIQVFAFFQCYFNSRPHGGRLRTAAAAIHTGYFNSRPHGGRRQI